MSDSIRNIKKIVAGREAVDGAGVHLIRVFGHRDTGDFDPFLLLDAFDSKNPEDYTAGFPWHPHRGIETITYLVKGEMAHEDSLGNKGSILEGECQWMRAGSGILHQEMPRAADHMLGLQLWLNLPATDKMALPAYNGISQESVPVVKEAGVEIRVISGFYKETPGATQGRNVQATYFDVTLDKGGTWEFETRPGETLFIYAFYGGAIFGEDEGVTAPRQAVLFDQGKRFVARAVSEPTRFVLLMAEPLKEPIAWGGPIVMNTKEALDQAFKDLEEGTFIKDPGVRT